MYYCMLLYGQHYIIVCGYILRYTYLMYLDSSLRTGEVKFSRMHSTCLYQVVHYFPSLAKEMTKGYITYSYTWKTV